MEDRGAEKSEEIKNGGHRSREEGEDKEWRTKERIHFSYILFTINYNSMFT